MNLKIIEQRAFFEEQLFETQQALFSATNIRQVKFLQNKIQYLRDRLRESGRN